MSMSLLLVRKDGAKLNYVFNEPSQVQMVAEVRKALHDGTVYYCQYFDNGTVKYGKYLKNGKWVRTTPQEMNEMLELSGERKLFEQNVYVNDDSVGITRAVMKHLSQVFNIQGIVDKMKQNCVQECYV